MSESSKASKFLEYIDFELKQRIEMDVEDSNIFMNSIDWHLSAGNQNIQFIWGLKIEMNHSATLCQLNEWEMNFNEIFKNVSALSFEIVWRQ